jgi:hypothetical protein
MSISNNKTSLIRMMQRRKQRRPRKSQDGGHAIRVSPHPNSFVNRPWYNIVVRVEQPGMVVDSTMLTSALATQLGITATTEAWFLRFQAVKVWGNLVPFSSTSPLIGLSVSIFDPIAGSFNGSVANRVLQSLTDYPDLTRRAAVGYRYPKAQREVAFYAYDQAATNVQLLRINGGGDEAIVYFYLQWRPGDQSPPPLLDDDDLVDVSKIGRDELCEGPDGRIMTLADKFRYLRLK